MKRKKLFYFIGIFVSIITILILVLFFAQKAPIEVIRFEEEFGLKLPKETGVVFSEDDHGALGDGTRLYIYQLTPTNMSEFKQQLVLNSWRALPFDGKLALGLFEKIKGISSENIANAMRFGSNSGYYLVKNRYGTPLKGFDFNDISYSNIIICVIDLDNYRIYYYTLDM